MLGHRIVDLIGDFMNVELITPSITTCSLRLYDAKIPAKKIRITVLNCFFAVYAFVLVCNYYNDEAKA